MKKIPHTYVIIFAVIVLCAILTYIIPAGEFQRQTITTANGNTSNIIDRNSFHHIDQNPQLWSIFTSFAKGFVAQAEIIIFILLIGGAFWILNVTNALNIGIQKFTLSVLKLEKLKLFKHIDINNVVLVLIMTIFSLFGAVFGMSEETIAFIILFVPLAISMGYDSITGVCIVYVAAHLGFAGCILNPFTIGIAQSIAQLPLFSGIGYRIVCWLIINTIGFTFILMYANRIKKNPQSSLTYEIDKVWKNHISVDKQSGSAKTKSTSAWVTYVMISIVMILVSVNEQLTSMTIGNDIMTFAALPLATVVFMVIGFITLRKSVHFYIIHLLLFTILILLIGVMGYGWYITEIGALFFAMGIMAGISSQMSANAIATNFIAGAKDILSAAMVVGLAGGIIVILNDGHIIDTIMYSLSNAMHKSNKIVSLGIMYAIQTGLNLIMPSGSAKAALTMPIMIPFSDLMEISRQATVTAFQFGDGFTNMITPTSGVLMGVLGMAKIPYDKWFRFFFKFILLLILLGFLLLIPTVTMQLAGF